MKSKYSSLDTRWCEMDVRHLELSDNSVDVAIDKGTLDAMIHGSLWDPPDDVRSNVGMYVDEVGLCSFDCRVIILTKNRLGVC
jgi:EEF1A lysine methyltransferase 4